MIALSLLLSLGSQPGQPFETHLASGSAAFLEATERRAADDWRATYSQDGPGAGRVKAYGSPPSSAPQSESTQTVVVIHDDDDCEVEVVHHDGEERQVKWRHEDPEWLLRLSCGDRDFRPRVQWDDAEIREFGVELSNPVFGDGLIYTDFGFQWGEDDSPLDLGVGTPSGIDFWELSVGFSLRQDVEILGFDALTRFGVGWAWQSIELDAGGILDTEYRDTPYLDAGLDFRISRDVLLGFKYRITPRLDFDEFGQAPSSSIDELGMHSLTLGLTFEI